MVRRSRPALDGPGEQDLRGSLFDSLGDGDDDGILHQIGLATVAQGRESLQDDAVAFAIVQKVPLRQIRMGFDVNHRGLNPRGI